MFSWDLLMGALVFGVLLGCFYAAVSIGLSLSFGLLDVPNIAHPALLVTGGYGTCGWLVTAGTRSWPASHWHRPSSCSAY